MDPYQRKRQYELDQEDAGYTHKVNKHNLASDGGNDALLVAKHYNQRPEIGVVKRKESRIIRLRSFNNWVKSVLIQRYARPQQCVLDMGCGKGGDLIKWAKAKINYLIAADIAAVSLEQMKERYKGLRDKTFEAEFHAFDCYSEPLQPYLQTHRPIDIVSMQFCLHYAFETEQKARRMLQNVTSQLRSGGYFIGTIPDAHFIVKKVRNEPPHVFGFGNDYYWIEFENDVLQQQGDQKVGFTRFGCKYMFHLEDAVDCPEYLVHWNTFESLANEYGLELVLKQNFHPFYQQAKNSKDGGKLLQRIGVVGGHLPEMSNEEWEAAGIYLAFAFRKK
ncbi:guanine-N(7)-methyltransferase domain-containing protein [Cunninghamella echinulata]|nr:guanine-N(7)-methyltransferase domain-containing protein [Cunninghamella echinulata]